MFRIVLWPPLLLCCLLCGKTMALILAFAGRQAIWQRTVPVRSTSLVQPPLLSTSPTHFSPFLFFPSLLCVWCGGLFGVYFVPAVKGVRGRSLGAEHKEVDVGSWKRADLSLLRIVPQSLGVGVLCQLTPGCCGPDKTRGVGDESCPQHPFPRRSLFPGLQAVL